MITKKKNYLNNELKNESIIFNRLFKKFSEEYNSIVWLLKFKKLTFKNKLLFFIDIITSIILLSSFKWLFEEFLKLWFKGCPPKLIFEFCAKKF